MVRYKIFRSTWLHKNALTDAYQLALSARDSYKATTLSDINNTIAMLQASVTQKESALLNATTDVDLINAKTQKDNAEITASSYKSKMLAQCKQTADELGQKIRVWNMRSTRQNKKANSFRIWTPHTMTQKTTSIIRRFPRSKAPSTP